MCARVDASATTEKSNQKQGSKQNEKLIDGKIANFDQFMKIAATASGRTATAMKWIFSIELDSSDTCEKSNRKIMHIALIAF